MYERKQYTHVLRYTLGRKVLQQLQLSQRPQRKHWVVERGNLLDGDLGVGRPVQSRNDDTVCAFTDDVEDLVRVAYVVSMAPAGMSTPLLPLIDPK